MQKRIQVYADDEIKRRIELAAAKYDMPVTEYCMQAIYQQLVDDDLLEREQIEIFVDPFQRRNQIERLRQLHHNILASRKGEFVEIDKILEAVRDEREDELIGLY